MDIEQKLWDWRNGLISNSELLMHTMVIRRRLFEIETELLNCLRADEDKAADERMERLGINKIIYQLPQEIET